MKISKAVIVKNYLISLLIMLLSLICISLFGNSDSVSDQMMWFFGVLVLPLFFSTYSYLSLKKHAQLNPNAFVDDGKNRKFCTINHIL